MLKEHIDETVDAIMAADPAAKSRLEVLLCYPGLHALTIYRIAHNVWTAGHYTAARFLSQVARTLTGIEIHPGATIGRRFVIDHGMGVVIGETTVIGDDCFIYQGVTLGAGAEARQGAATRDLKRHPTLRNGVIVGSGAEIQGNIVVGNNVRVASGSIVLKDVPDNSIVVGVPGRVIYRDGKRVDEGKVPDIEAEAIKRLKQRLEALEKQVGRLDKNSPHQEGEATLPNEKAADKVTENFDPDKTDESNWDEPDGSDPVDVFLQGAGI